jgi:hypothetical protein
MATKKVTKKVAKKVTKRAKPAAKPRRPAPGAKKVARVKKAARTKTVAAKKKASRGPKRSAPAARRPPAARKTTAKVTPKAPKRARGRAPVQGARAGKAVRRFDRPGHLDPKYAADLRRQSGVEEKDPRAFLDGPRSPNDDLAEERGEEVVEKATTGEDAGEESLDQVVPEEDGGPFVETSGTQEFAEGADLSNPKGAFREPFPTT